MRSEILMTLIQAARSLLSLHVLDMLMVGKKHIFNEELLHDGILFWRVSAC